MNRSVKSAQSSVPSSADLSSGWTGVDVLRWMREENRQASGDHSTAGPFEALSGSCGCGGSTGGPRMKSNISDPSSYMVSPELKSSADPFKAVSAKASSFNPREGASVLVAGAQTFFRQDASSRTPGARDFSNPVYIPERNTWTLSPDVKSNVAPSEFLQALPFVKGTPLTVITATAAEGTTLNVVIQKDAVWENDAASTIYLPTSTTINEGPSQSPGPDTLPLVRMGLRITALKIDSAVSPSASQDPSAWRVVASTNRLLLGLDQAVGTGIDASFQGLADLAAGPSPSQFLDGTGVSLDDAAANLLGLVSTTGRGCGEGVHCLIGNNAMLTALMKTATSRANGSCCWKHDPRTGLTVFHYLGVPFYRANVEPRAGGEDGAFLFAANLGPTGLSMVHAYGTRESYGLEVDAESTNAAKLARDIIVHGAWQLIAWEDGAVYGYHTLTIP